MRAILINPMQESIRHISYDGDYQNIYNIRCTTFEAVYPFDIGDTLWIDEEGLLKESNFAFKISDKADDEKIPIWSNDYGKCFDFRYRCRGRKYRM